MSASALCTGSTEIPSRQNAFLMRFSRICNWVFHAKSHQALVWRIVWSNPKKICFVRSSCHKFRLVVTGLNVQFSFKQIYHCHGIYLNNLRCFPDNIIICLTSRIASAHPSVHQQQKLLHLMCSSILCLTGFWQIEPIPEICPRCQNVQPFVKKNVN